MNTDYVKEIDRRPEPVFEMLDIVRLELGQIDIEIAARDDLVAILIIDSGVMQRHPLLGRALGDAQVFPDRQRERVAGGAEDGDERTGGHGTAVAGIAVHSDVGDCIARPSWYQISSNQCGSSLPLDCDSHFAQNAAGCADRKRVP